MRAVKVGITTAIISLSFAITASAQTLTAAENQGQPTLDAYVATVVPGSPEASQIESQKANDPMIRQAILDNAVQTDVVEGTVSTTVPPPLSASATASPLVSISYFHGAVSSTHYWSDFLTGWHFAWTRATMNGWYYSGAYITGVQGWNLQDNDWTGTGYCRKSQSYGHNGYGNANSNGNTAWAHGYHKITISNWLPIIGCGINGSTAQATVRIAGNGYWDKLY